MDVESLSSDFDEDVVHDERFIGALHHAMDAKIAECPHTDVVEESGVLLCMMCGCEQKVLDYSPEWRNYDNTTNTSRCTYARKTVSTIDKLLDSLNLSCSEEQKRSTEEKYALVADGKTLRGTARRAIIAACFMYTLRESGDYRAVPQICELFNLTKKSLCTGISRFVETFPETRISPIRPEHLANGIVTKLKIPYSHLSSIIKLITLLSKCSRVMMHSSPQSVTAAIIYLYLCMNPELKETLGLTKAKFAEQVGLSDITVTKLAKEAASEAKDFLLPGTEVIVMEKRRAVRRTKK